MPENRPHLRSTVAGLLLALLALPASEAWATPVSPSQLRGVALSDERIRLRWQDNACDDTSQHLQVRTSSQWIEIPFSLPPDETEVILSGLESATEYDLRVVSRGPEGSAVSPPVTVTTFPATARCTVDNRQLCLFGGRFAVTATFEPHHGAGATRQAHAVPDGDRTGSFWFFDAGNLELNVELTDGRGANGHFWIAGGALSDLEYRILVTDTQTGRTRVYVNPTHSLCGFDDRHAFEADAEAMTVTEKVAPPNEVTSGPDPSQLYRLAIDTSTDFRPGWRPAKHSCFLDNAQLNLHGGRFQVRLQWRDEGIGLQPARPRHDSSDSGFFVVDRPDLADWALKILDGRAVNDHYWLFVTPLSGRAGQLEVTDTATGLRRTVRNSVGSKCTQVYLQAFPAAP